jgi:formylglycine-generating enzyme required for sulfatase activity
VRDYAEYAREKGITPEEPSFEQGPTHPVVMVDWDDANAFCGWLTEKERASGRIGQWDEYRLPSDHEWSCAVGIGRLEKAEDRPDAKSAKIEDVYPWGTAWPPPKGAGNYGQAPANAGMRSPYGGVPKGAGNDGQGDNVDEFEFTSPVGSFSANQNGLYDLGGNVSQWCEDWTGTKREFRVLRGGDFIAAGEVFLRSSRRWGGHPSDRRGQYGFRCVLANSGG